MVLRPKTAEDVCFPCVFLGLLHDVAVHPTAAAAVGQALQQLHHVGWCAARGDLESP